MKTNRIKDQFLSLTSKIKNSKASWILVIVVPLFLLAGQGIVSASRSQTQAEISAGINNALAKKMAQRQIIRTAVYNQYATVNYYNR